LDETKRKIEAQSLIHQKELHDLLSSILTEKEKDIVILQGHVESLVMRLNEATDSPQESHERVRVIDVVDIDLNIRRSEMSDLKQQSIDQKKSIKDLTIKLDNANSKAALSDSDAPLRKEEVLKFDSNVTAERKELKRVKAENETLREQSDDQKEKIKELTTQLNRLVRMGEEEEIEEENEEEKRRMGLMVCLRSEIKENSMIPKAQIVTQLNCAPLIYLESIRPTTVAVVAVVVLVLVAEVVDHHHHHHLRRIQMRLAIKR
jgi:hypothetical protein